MSAGKTAAQVAHASVGACENADNRVRKSWEDEGAKKVVLQVATLDEMLELKQKVKALPTKLIKDAGMTELSPGTITCLAIGPADEKELDKITGSLKLLD